MMSELFFVFFMSESLRDSFLFFGHLMPLFHVQFKLKLYNATINVRWRYHLKFSIWIMLPTDPSFVSDCCFQPLFHFSPNRFGPLFHFTPNLHFSPKRLLVEARFKPPTSQSNTWCTRPQDHGVLLRSELFALKWLSFLCCLLSKHFDKSRPK